MRDVVGAEDHIDMRGTSDDRLPVLLGKATADGDLDAGTTVDGGLQLAKVAVELVVPRSGGCSRC